jgi:hypothetical protein
MGQNLLKMNDEIENHKFGAVLNNEVYPAETTLDDISDLIVRRINHGYGLDIETNAKLSPKFALKGINVGKY